MPFGPSSAIFAKTIADALGETGDFGTWDDGTGRPNGGVPDGDFMVALYDDSHAGPDRMQPNPVYGAAPWIPAAAVIDPNWPAAGRPLANTTFTGDAQGNFPPYIGLAGTRFSGDDTAGAGPVTLTDVWGDLLYKPGAPVAGQGSAFHSFGGPNSVTAGLFTVIWHAAGIMIVTVAGTITP